MDCSIPAIPVFTATPLGPYPECTSWRAGAFRYIRSLKPTAVVVAFGAEGTSVGHFDLAVWLSGLRTSMRTLVGTGARVVEIGTQLAV